eukprot:376167_1
MSKRKCAAFGEKASPCCTKAAITEYNTLTDEDWKGFDNISVICRFRPSNRREKEYSTTKDIADSPPKFESSQTVSCKRVDKQTHSADTKHKAYKCTLDSILMPTTKQKQVFNLIGQS